MPPVFGSGLALDIILPVWSGHAFGSAEDLSIEGEGAYPRV